MTLKDAVDWARMDRGGCKCASCSTRADVAKLLQHLADVRAACAASPACDPMDGHYWPQLHEVVQSGDAIVGGVSQ